MSGSCTELGIRTALGPHPTSPPRGNSVPEQICTWLSIQTLPYEESKGFPLYCKRPMSLWTLSVLCRPLYAHSSRTRVIHYPVWFLSCLDWWRWYRVWNPFYSNLFFTNYSPNLGCYQAQLHFISPCSRISALRRSLISSRPLLPDVSHLVVVAIDSSDSGLCTYWLCGHNNRMHNRRNSTCCPSLWDWPLWQYPSMSVAQWVQETKRNPNLSLKMWIYGAHWLTMTRASETTTHVRLIPL